MKFFWFIFIWKKIRLINYKVVHKLGEHDKQLARNTRSSSPLTSVQKSALDPSKATRQNHEHPRSRLPSPNVFSLHKGSPSSYVGIFLLEKCCGRDGKKSFKIDHIIAESTVFETLKWKITLSMPIKFSFFNIGYHSSPMGGVKVGCF